MTESVEYIKLEPERSEASESQQDMEIVPGLWIRGTGTQNEFVEIIAPKSRTLEIIECYYKGVATKLKKDTVSISPSDLIGLLGPLPPFEILTHTYIDGVSKQRETSTLESFNPHRRQELFARAIDLFEQWKFRITFEPLKPQSF